MNIQIDINTYKSKFTDVSRQYLFWMNIQFPGVGNAGMQIGTMSKKMSMADIPFYVKSSSLPSSSFEDMTSTWMGNTFKVPGNKTYEDWTVTFNLDSEGYILKKFHDWQKMMRDPISNMQSNPSSLMVNQEAHLLNSTGNTISVYKLYYAWPKSIGQVSLDYGSNEVSTVDVTFSYQFFNVYDQPQGAVRETIRKAGIGIAGGL